MRNRTDMIGFDGTIAAGAFELKGQYLRRTDSRPTFTVGELENTVEGGFAEVVVRSPRSRWYGFGLYNLVTSDRPILDVRLGTPRDIQRYESRSLGVGRLERRNFRWTAEATYDPGQDSVRWTLGIVSAF